MIKMSALKRLKRSQSGVTVVEFAVVAPVFLTLMMGTFDVAHTLYIRSVLQGEVYKAARDSSAAAGQRGSRQTQIDDKLRAQIRKLLPADAIIDGPTRANFETYQDAGTFVLAEPFTDSNGDGECNNGELYQDRNSNGQYDDRSGSYVGTEKDQGGARDVVRYSVKVTYDGFFPLPARIGEREILAESVIVNQPFDKDLEANSAPCT
jgi:Flp pilus assembly protein TadG